MRINKNSTRYFLILLLYLGTRVAQADASPSGEIRIKPNLSGLTVKLCNLSPRMVGLANPHPQADAHLRWMKIESDQRVHNLTPLNGKVKLKPLPANHCVKYEVDFRGKITHPWYATRQSTHKQVLVDIAPWFWYPQPFPEGGLPVSVHAPSGLKVSVPWPVIERSAHTTRYLIRKRPLDWDARMAVGEFSTADFQINQAQIRVALLNGKAPVNQNKIMHWIKSNLNALSLAYGDFPVPELQILVVPIGKDREPVPWGQVQRGGGDAVHVYIDQTRPLQEFLDDWVLIHELSHLLHPRLYGEDAWLYEGLASYYQNVLRARAGLLPARQAWQKLHNGFQRGIEATDTRHTLSQESENMLRDKNFMRVYWSGAAIFLLADRQLREKSAGTNSLDRTLRRLHACCLPATRWWTAAELMDRLDQLSGTNVFSELFNKHLPASTFPDLSPTYESFGLVVTNGRITLENDAPAFKIRDAIFQSSATTQ